MDHYKKRKKKEKEDETEREIDRKRAAYEEAMEEDRRYPSGDTAVALVAAGFEFMEVVMNTGLGEMLDEAVKKRNEIFQKRYKKVFEAAPDMSVARIQYFCTILLGLVPAMTKGSHKERCFAYDDFFELYMEGVDMTLSGWRDYDREAGELAEEVEDEYPFLQTEITKENMGSLLMDILGKIIVATPEKDTVAKRDFLLELTRLFEVCRWSVFEIADENGKR